MSIAQATALGPNEAIVFGYEGDENLLKYQLIIAVKILFKLAESYCST